MIMRITSLIIIAILLISCKESKQDKIARLVDEWNGKIIRFPDNMCLTSYAKDTVVMKYVRDRYPFTILNYVDTIGCMSCKLQLPRWKDMLEEIDSVYPNRVSCLMVFYPKGKRRFIKHLRDNHFDRFVYIDEMDSLNRMNNFLHEEHFCTFLLDKNDKIVAIGNPILNYNVKKMYLNIISGKTLLSSVGKQSLTIASISKEKIDLGTFSWNDTQEVEIQISNVGENALVVNDVATSCGCILVEYSKEPIQPNKTLSMKIKYKADRPEYFDKTIIISCNVKDTPLQLRISGNAK
ncbi:MAG: DUF1573 domain-containing protein [Bacteroides thetaiotaomicron]